GKQVGLDDAEVHEAFLQQATFVGYIELALGRIKQGEQRGLEQMEGQHRLIDLIPEGIAVASDQSGVGINHAEQVRQYVGRHLFRSCLDDIETEQQIHQRGCQEHEARN